MTIPKRRYARRIYRGALCLSLASIALAGRLHAQDATPTICTDRPTKANATCTVPAGTWQLESDLLNVTHDRQGDATTDTLYYTNPTIKYGLGDRTDIQFSLAPRLRVETKDHLTGERHVTTGGGDIYLRLKTRLVDSDAMTLAIIPFVKAPTAAHGLGNDRWEGGIALPLAFPVGAGFSLTLGPEVDVLADADGSGHHEAFVNLVNVSHALGSKVTLAVELWDSSNHDPSGTVRQRSADVALSCLLSPLTQIDVGANIGLNRATPDRQLYVGVSTRF